MVTAQGECRGEARRQRLRRDAIAAARQLGARRPSIGKLLSTTGNGRQHECLSVCTEGTMLPITMSTPRQDSVLPQDRLLGLFRPETARGQPTRRRSLHRPE